MGVSGFEIDVGAESVTGDGDREVQDGEGGVGDGPGEFEVGVKGIGEVDELIKLLMRAQGSTITLISIAEEEVRDGAHVTVEEGLFHVSYKEAGIAWTHTGANSYTFALWDVKKLKEKLLRVRTSSFKWMRVPVEGDCLDLRDRKKRKAFRPSSWRIQ
eukprot:g41475.t1